MISKLLLSADEGTGSEHGSGNARLPESAEVVHVNAVKGILERDTQP